MARCGGTVRGPPPAGARLGLYRHGDTVSKAAALELCALPTFPDSWLIVPTAQEDSLTLAWGNACTGGELERASAWNAAQLARSEADRLPVRQARLPRFEAAQFTAHPASVFLRRSDCLVKPSALMKPPTMIDPMHLAAALNFLTSSPAPQMTLSPADPTNRRRLLEDTAGAFEDFAQHDGPLTGPAQVAAYKVFRLAGVVWRECLSIIAGPDTAALNLHAWAQVRLQESLHGLPTPLTESLAQSFPDVGGWAATVYVSGALSLPDVGRAAAWWAVCFLAARTAGPSFEDGEPEDVLLTILTSLQADAGRAKN